MTLGLTGRIEMAESDELTLDELFARLERMPVPEGYKTEVVEGAVSMSPRRDTHWQIILDTVQQLLGRYAKNRLLSDVRLDFPGRLNGFAPDVAALRADAAKDDRGRWQYDAIECVVEVVSGHTRAYDYGPKKDVYAAAGVPVYVVADPGDGVCHVFTRPKEGVYRSELTTAFGEPVDLAGTVVDLVLETGDFPRD